ncbi:MAG TPA: hypothetical protein VGS19_29185, partial [Streptosporangiaceae bacterium]|nr:hypothetical protein [Streptosporangiaceae bacterium]
ALFKVWFATIKAIFTVGLAVLKAVWNVAWAVVYGVVKTAWDLIAQTVHTAIQFITGIIGIALDLVTGHWSQAWHDMATLAAQMLADITNIIRTSVTNFGSLLFNAGKALVQGLINGITSMFGAVGNAVGSIAHTVAGFFGLSPARWGPLSGSGAPEVRGRHFAQALAAGINAGSPAVAAAAGRLAGAAALGPAGRMGAGGAGMITLRIDGTDSGIIGMIIYLIRKQIRAQYGGNVQAALGRG